MAAFLGIDIGTSGTKVIAIDENGALLASASAAYELLTPRPMWAEQRPGDWWTAVCECCQKIVAEIGADTIMGIGLSGQMHGLVMLDGAGKVLRDAILWCDQRTQQQCDFITQKVGLSTLVAETCNPVLTGFTAPKIIWARDNEPEIYERATMHLLPKDYIRFRLTGEFATEVSDASGTSLLNVPQRQWSQTVCDALEIPLSHLPAVYESFEISGRVSTLGAQATGLKVGTPVVGGGGDQAAGAVGNGVVRSGVVSVASGTSGVVFASSELPTVDAELRVHTFCHAVPNTWHVMGVMLSAGGSLKWFRDTFAPGVSYDELCQEAATVKAGSEGLLFLPYLTGERTPHPDPLARGAFIGLTVRHTRAHLTRAVLEGVGFGLCDSLEILKSMAVPINGIRASGGGAKSPVWRQIQADIFNYPLSTITIDEGPALGAALLAAVGAGTFSSVEEACNAVVQTAPGALPGPANAAVYERTFELYRQGYPNLKSLFQMLGSQEN